MSLDKNPRWDLTIESANGSRLEACLATPQTAESKTKNAVVVLHSFPSQEVFAADIGSDLPNLTERISSLLECSVLGLRFQGCGYSEGNFSLKAWLEDANSGFDYLLAELGATNLWVAGFGTGGAVGLVASVGRDTVKGVVTVAAPADFDDWAANPEQLLEHSKEVGVVSSDGFPADFQDWKAELRQIRAVESAEKLRSKSLLVMHGSEDEVVPHFDARLIADAHGDADLRFINGGSHQLRQDPRAFSVLVGWLGRQQVMQGSSGISNGH